mgnify:FL=1
MKKIPSIFSGLLIFSFVFAFSTLLYPAFTSAEPLIPCDGGPTNGCDFDDLMALINTVIDFLIFDLALPIAAVVIAYAGFLFLTSGDDSGKRTKAKKMLVNIVIGLVLALASWLIVQTILLSLGYDGPLFLSND